MVCDFVVNCRCIHLNIISAVLYVECRSLSLGKITNNNSDTKSMLALPLPLPFCECVWVTVCWTCLVCQSLSNCHFMLANKRWRWRSLTLFNIWYFRTVESNRAALKLKLKSKSTKTKERKLVLGTVQILYTSLSLHVRVCVCVHVMCVMYTL